MTTQNYKYIGCANGWSERVWTMADGSKRIEKEDTTPEVYKQCVSANHKQHEVKKGNCWYQVFCSVCGISWDYDSSD